MKKNKKRCVICFGSPLHHGPCLMVGKKDFQFLTSEEGEAEYHRRVDRINR